MRETKYSRMPVFGENLDDIVGVVTVRDLVEHEGADGDPLRPLVRPAFLVPETKKIAELLKEFQARRTTFAVVIDEYGGTAGPGDRWRTSSRSWWARSRTSTTWRPSRSRWRPTAACWWRAA